MAAPATRKLARELGVKLDDVAGSGPHGRITQDDVRKHAEGGMAPTQMVKAAAPAYEPISIAGSRSSSCSPRSASIG